MPRNALPMFAISCLLAGCAAHSHVIIGKVRPPIAPTEVRIYLQPPKSYEQIAIVDASSQGSFTFTQQQKADKAIQRLKEEAARLGANGVLLQSTGAKPVASIGTGFGSASFNGNTAVGTGIGLSGDVVARTANGVAIYVIEE